jgi:sigma-B regulation protein RsbU (phosphoserine phosphatase)
MQRLAIFADSVTMQMAELMEPKNEEQANTSKAGRDITRVILEHAARISKEQDISALIGLNAALARDLVEGDRSSVWLIDDAKGELWTRVADGIGEVRIPKSTGLVGACIAQNEIIVANDLSNDARFHRQMDKSSGYHTESILCVPLRADDKVIGALQVLNKPGGFSKQDAELLRLMAVYAASAIQAETLRSEAEVARLLRHELDIARDVQMRLLPRVHGTVPGIEYTGFCRSARMVGGDYYDLLPLQNGSFAFTLGDVSGKGIPAAVLMASIHTLLRSLLLRNSEDLSYVVQELNEAVHRSSSDDRFSTLFCGVVSADRKHIRYVNAGHIPAFLVSHEGAIERPTGTNLPIGIMEGRKYSEGTMPVKPGSLLVCVSDGICEAKNTLGEFWDEERIDEVLHAHRESSVKQVNDALVQAADHWADGAEQHDDMTVVALRIAS